MSLFVYLVGTLLLMTGVFAIPFAFYLDVRGQRGDLGEQLTAAQDHAVRLDTELQAERARNRDLVDDNAGMRAQLDALSIAGPRLRTPALWAEQLSQKIRDLPTTGEVDS